MKGISIWLGGNHRQLFKTDMPIFMDSFCSDASIRAVIENYYNELVQTFEVVAIENMEQTAKYNLKQLGIMLSKGKLDTNGMVQLCKCLQVMRYHKII